MSQKPHSILDKIAASYFSWVYSSKTPKELKHPLPEKIYPPEVIAEKLKNIQRYGLIIMVFWYIEIIIGVVVFVAWRNYINISDWILEPSLSEIAAIFFIKYNIITVVGILLIFCGNRIRKWTDNSAWVYIVFSIFIFTFLLWITTLKGDISSLSLYFLIYALITNYNIKYLSSKVEEKIYIIKGIGWYILFVIWILIIWNLGFLIDISQRGVIQEVQIDKSQEFVEQVGNLYRNKKYKFKIEFPEWWKQDVGGWSSVLITSSGSIGKSTWTMAIEIKKEEGVSNSANINDLWTLNEFSEKAFASVLKQSSDAKILETRELKINNVLAYWIKYSAYFSDKNIKIGGIFSSYTLCKNGFLYTIQTLAVNSIDGVPVVSKTIPLLMEKSVQSFAFED